MLSRVLSQRTQHGASRALSAETALNAFGVFERATLSDAAQAAK